MSILSQFVIEDKSIQVQLRNVSYYIQQILFKFISNNPSAIKKYPHLEDVLRLSKLYEVDRYDNMVPPSILETIVKDLITLETLDSFLEDPLKEMSLHPKYPLLYAEDLIITGLQSKEVNMEITNILKKLGSLACILEIGFGTGGFLKRYLPILKPYINEYIATDYIQLSILPEQFDNINIYYKRWNIDRPILNLKSKVDIVIGCNSVHTCSSIQKTLKYISEITRPGGYLILEEQGNDMLCYFWGLDESIWSTPRDKRSFGLWMSREEWEIIFKDNTDWVLEYLFYNDRSVVIIVKRCDET